MGLGRRAASAAIASRISGWLPQEPPMTMSPESASATAAASMPLTARLRIWRMAAACGCAPLQPLIVRLSKGAFLERVLP